MKYGVNKKIQKSVGGVRFPATKPIARFDTRKEAEDEAKRLETLMPEKFVVDKINENGAAKQLPKVMAKTA